jgi:hypothetical protein
MPPKKELTMRPSFGVFAFLSVLAFNPSAHAESYTLPGESSPPAAEELIGSPGLVGIYYGQLPKDGHPRLKMTLVLVANPKSGEPNGYMLERIGVMREPNTRHITKGTWKRIKDGNRPGAVVYELDSQAPAEYSRFWAIDRSTLLVLESDLKVRRSGLGDPYTAAYGLYGLHCNPGQRLKDCSAE